MPWIALLFGQMFGGILLSIAGSLVSRVLTALAIGTVAYVGLDSSLAFFKTSALSALNGLPSAIVGILSLMQVGSAISMVFSAMLMRLVYQGLSSGSVKSWVKK